MPGVERDHVYIQDQGTGLRYGAASYFRGDPNNTDRHSQRFSVSYVTGSHNFKVGVHVEELLADTYHRQNGNVHYRFRNGVPNRITQWATPYTERSRILPDLGIYAQDQWVIDKLTLNLGARLDWLRGYVPAQNQPEEPHAGAWPGDPLTNPWFPPGTRVFDRVDNAPNWKDFSPRLGLAYDLFGDGRTAVKASLSRYVGKMGTFMTQLNNPINTSVNSATRAWNDGNGNYVPDCDLGNFDANGECGKIGNVNFGKNNPRAIQWDPELLNGANGRRDYNWDMSLELQQEVREGFSVTTGFYQNTGGYYEQRWSKTRVTDNLGGDTRGLRPVLHHRPDGSAVARRRRLRGLRPLRHQAREVRPGGRLQNLERALWRRQASEPVSRGDLRRAAAERHSFRWRVRYGPVARGPLLRRRLAAGTAPLPGRDPVERADAGQAERRDPAAVRRQLQRHLPEPVGESILANYSVSNAEVSKSLGRSLAGGFGSVTVPLVAPDTLFLDRIDRLDIRVSKIIRTDRFRIQINLDAYNALNASHIRSVAQFYGSRFLEPNTIMDARLSKSEVKSVSDRHVPWVGFHRIRPGDGVFGRTAWTSDNQSVEGKFLL